MLTRLNHGLGGNLGSTAQKPHRNTGDPMARFDALPTPLRRWMTEAALPWSPASCRRLWTRARRSGASIEEALAALERAEQQALERETKRRAA